MHRPPNHHLPTSRSPRYRLLALDIDGTLVNIRDEISPPTRRALDRALAAGVQVALVTGRRYSRALPIVRALALDVPLVTASGSLIKHPADHRTLFVAELPRATLQRVLAVVEQVGHQPLLYADTYHEGFDFYCARVEHDGPELREFFALNAGCQRIWPDLVRDPPPGVFGAFAMGTRVAMCDLERQLQDHLPGALYTHVLRSPKYQGFMCEIAPVGVTKWSGVLHLAELLQLSAAEICAVGDDVNDIPMIAGAGLGVAMGNALDEVKAVADRVAPPLDQDGLVDVVEWILET